MHIYGRLMLTVAVVGLATAATASAQTVNGYFDTNQSLRINSGLGGWTVNLTSCLYTLSNVATPCYNTATSTPNVEVVASVSHDTLSLLFEAAAGGPLETSAPGLTSDLTVSVLVTPPSGNFWQATANETGSSTGGAADLSRLSVSDSVLTLSYGSATGASSNLANSPSLSTAVFAPSPTLSANVDIKAQGGGVRGNSLGTLSLNTATILYSVPEPVSSGMLAVGLAGLGFARRRRGRK